jgi:hypothetical protein
MLLLLLILITGLTYKIPFLNEHSLVLNTSNMELRLSISKYGIKCKDQAGKESLIAIPEGDRLVYYLVTRRTTESDESLVVIFGKDDELYGDRIEIYGVSDSGEAIKVIDYSMENMNPWEIKTADVNGDGIQEIGVTVYKKTRFHPVLANRPYIYSWNEDELSPYWRGSRLSRPFSQYGYKDINNDGCDELVAIEYLENKREVINAYGWKGFGFETIGQSESFSQIENIKVNNDEPLQPFIYNHWTEFSYDVDNELIEKKTK